MDLVEVERAGISEIVEVIYRRVLPRSLRIGGGCRVEAFCRGNYQLLETLPIDLENPHPSRS